MLSKGRLVRQFLVTSQERDTLCDLRGGFKPVSCHFKQADETLLPSSSENQRLSFWQGKRHDRAAC
jgi:hypothetical protein